jgi:hypothetical protein
MRRGDSKKIRKAQRAGTLARRTRGGRISLESAEVLLAAWEAEAVERGLVPESNAYQLKAGRLDYVARSLSTIEGRSELVLHVPGVRREVGDALLLALQPALDIGDRVGDDQPRHWTSSGARPQALWRGRRPHTRTESMRQRALLFRGRPRESRQAGE